jgi:hypothetical protein
MRKAFLVLVIYASAGTFRRAGHGFTSTGTAYPADYFSKDQLTAIHAEPRLSVKEVQSDAIPQGVDRSHVDALLAKAEKQAATSQETAEEAKRKAAETEAEKIKAAEAKKAAAAKTADAKKA